MPGKSARDQCFGDALDAWNDTHPNDQINMKSQQSWVLDGGRWRPVGALENLWHSIIGGTPYRTPDWTLYESDGTPVAGDNKFSGDRFSNRTSPRTGNTQLHDQNNMNQQNSPDKPEYQDLNLNPEDCNCPEDGEPERGERLRVSRGALGKVYVPIGAGPEGAAAAEAAAAAAAAAAGWLGGLGGGLSEPEPIFEFAVP